MGEVGIDIGGQKPEPVDLYLDKYFDYVITVCDGAKEICPVFTGEVKHRFHIGFEDPAKACGTENEILSVYRKIRDQIREKFYEFHSQIFPL
jgi:arsenate reductase